MTRHALAFVVLLPSLAFAQTTSLGEKKRPPDPSRFPAVCEGFLESPHTRLAGVWGRYEGKHAGRIQCVAISPDGRRALTGASDSTVRLWDLATATERLKVAKTVYSAVFTADGRRAAVGEGARVTLLDLIQGKELKTFAASCQVSSLALSADGKRLVFGTENGDGSVVNLETGEQLNNLERRGGAVTALGLASSDKRVLEACQGGWIHLHDLESGTIVRSLQVGNGESGGIVFSADHKVALVATRNRELVLVDLATGETKSQVAVNMNEPLALSEDGSVALGADGDSVLVLETATGKQRRKLRGTGRPVTALAMSRDGKVAVGGFDDGVVRAWDLATGALVTSGTQTGPVVALSVAGDRAIVGGSDGALRVWDTRDGKLVRTLSATEACPAAVALVGSRAFSLCAQGVARTWDLDSGELLRSFDPDDTVGNAVVMSPDGKFAVSSYASTNDAEVKSSGLALRDLSGGGTFKSLEQQPADITLIALSPNGALALAASADFKIGLWDVPRLKLVRTFAGHISEVSALAFSPDGKRAWSASERGTIKVWDVATGEEIRTLEAHRGSVSQIAFSPDGSHAVTSSLDSSLAIWDVAKLETIDRISLLSSEDQASLIAFAENERFLVGTNRGVVLAFDLVK